MGILRVTKYKTSLKLSTAVFVLSAVIIASLVPALRANADAPVPALPVVWIDNAHTQAVDNSNNVYGQVGYACVVGASTITTADGSSVSTAAKPPTTISVSVDTETGSNVKPVTIPGCWGGGGHKYAAQYIWVSKTSPNYILIAYSSTTGTQLDPKQCPINGLNGCTATVWPLNSDGSLGSPYLLNNFKMTVDTSKATVAQAVVSGSTDTGNASDLKCQKSFSNPLTWLVCPMIAAANDAVKGFDGQISCLMQIDLTDVFGTDSNASNPYATACGTSANTITTSNGQTKASSDAYYSAWNTFRSFALALMVIAGLVMVISQAAGFELLDAYTVRKILPRLLIAGIAITLSWQIMQFLIQITNVVGFGIRDIIYFPFKDFGGLNISGFTTSFLGSGLTLLGGFGFLGLPGLGALALTALLGVLVAFITLVLRKLVIIFLLMLAPFAIACYILPNTQKFWKMWWDTLSKALLMFPIIAAMIAVGHVFAATTYGTGGGGATSQIIAFIAYFLPYFMIPTAVKMSGGVVGSIAGLVSNRAQGGFAALRKVRKEQVAKNWHAIKSGNRFEGGTEHNIRGRLNRGLQTATLIPSVGVNPSRWKSKAGEAVSRDTEHQRAAMMEDKDYTWNKMDSLNRAASETSNRHQLREALIKSGSYGPEDDLDTFNLNRDIERVELMRAKYEPAAFKQATFFNAVAGGTAYKGSEIWQAAAEIAGDDNGLLSTLIGQAKGLAMGAGRADQGGGSFGDTFGIAKDYRTALKLANDPKDPKPEILEKYKRQADQRLAATVLDNQGASVLAHPSMKPRMFEILVPEINRRLAAVNESGDQDAIDREYAKVANLYDHLASSSNLNATILADGVLRVDPNASSGQQLLVPGAIGPVLPSVRPIKTTLDRINERRASAVFQSTRRELNASEEQFNRISGGGTINPGSDASNPPNTSIS